MIKIVAPTLEEAYKKASVALDCSIVDIDIEILQAPSRGIFGLFSREAIINASHKSEKASSGSEIAAMKHTSASENVRPDDKLLREIEEGMQKLLESSCFEASVTSITLDEKNGVLITIDGEDAALMIGKEGYRYKALSYMIHNWIKVKYHLTSTLEIAQFLETQKEAIEKYLDTFSEKVNEAGRAQTKPLDGILVKLALESLRTRYVDKYVAIRTLKNGKKVIVVNEYAKK
jgi:spoIIIJ-associated protein